MFHDKHDDKAQQNTDIDQVAQDISGNDNSGPGLGHNPSTFNPVMPQQATTAPEPPADDTPHASDDSSGGHVVTPEPEVLDNAHQQSTDFGSGHSAPNADLEKIKNDALQQLSPLVGKIEQGPEDKFKTLMMLIQASDNHDLIQDAYNAAQGIEDETKKAEALLAVVNEINYFSQKHSN